MSRKLVKLLITFLIIVLLSGTVFAYAYHIPSSDFHEINETNGWPENPIFPTKGILTLLGTRHYSTSSPTALTLSDTIPSSDSGIHYNGTSLPSDVSQTRIENSTRIISSFGERKIGSQNAAEASLFIKNEMEEAGLQVSLDNFSVRVRTRNSNYWNMSGANVVGIKEGNALKDEIILVTAHYDSIILVSPKSGL